jgi:hypothetical protein
MAIRSNSALTARSLEWKAPAGKGVCPCKRHFMVYHGGTMICFKRSNARCGITMSCYSMKKYLGFVLLICLVLATPLSGVEPLPPLTAEEPPLDAAQQEKIHKLIDQLGDSHWIKREEATQSLEHIGEAALPFLKEALKNTDPEIQNRADQLIAVITPPVQCEDDVIIAKKGGLRITGNLAVRGRLSLTTGPVDKITIVTTARFPFKGRQFKVVRSFDGKSASISVDVTEKKDDTRHVEAADEAELEKKEPVLSKICKKRVGDLAGRQTQLRAEYSKMTGIP